MRNRSFLVSLLPVLGLFFSLTPSGNATVANRIYSINTQTRAPLQHTVSPRIEAATDLGSAAPNRVLGDLIVRFNMTATQQAALTQLLIDQQNPSSPKYHQWLTPEQFAAQFGLSSADIAKVSAWLVSQGFTVTGVARSGTFISFKGTVAQAQRAFNTSIHNVNLNGEQHFANTNDIALPPAIAGVVSTVTGLDDFKLRTQARVRTISPNLVHPQYTSGSGDHFIAPGDFNTIYNVNPLLSSSINGAGISIAIVGRVDLSLADVAAFRAASRLPANVPIVKTYGTDPGHATSSTSSPSTGDLAEAQLDVEWAGAVAPSATIIYVNSTDVINLSLPYAIDNNLAPIISISYGGCENNSSRSALDALNQLFQQANVMGITIVGPSGDSGATECDYQSVTASQGLAVSFPASSPFVTSMGGTMFNEGSGSYWNAGNGTASGSAKSYIPEAVWNESNTNGLGAGGGGASAYFSKPAWQQGVTPSDYARDVPDISLNSASNHDGYLFCLQGSCTNGYLNASGNFNVVGGTSVAAPSFAGILALIEQKIGSRIGNANPTLYALANSSYSNEVFHDITTGNNSSPCDLGTRDCASGLPIGYNAAPGYDQATGWGSIDAYNLANRWATVVDSTASRTISATSLTTSSSSCAVSSGTLALTAIVINGTFDSSGHPVVGATPTGNVQFLVDNVAVGSPVPLNGGTATYTLNTSTLSSGGHTITAAYSGDTTYAGSRGTLLGADSSPAPIDVVSSSQPDFSITPCGASARANSGSTAPGIAFNFTPFNGFNGTITLTATADLPVNASYAFSSGSSVVINSASGVASTFTLSAYQTKANGAAAKLKLASNYPSAVRMPWYVTGSGATLACVFLLVLPRRRRWGALLAVMISVGAISAIGCGSGMSSTANSTSPTSSSTSNPSVTNAAPGTYNITVTAVASNGTTNLVHSAKVVFTVQ